VSWLSAESTRAYFVASATIVIAVAIVVVAAPRAFMGPFLCHSLRPLLTLIALIAGFWSLTTSLTSFAFRAVLYNFVRFDRFDLAIRSLAEFKAFVAERG